ncbi:MAG: sigma factor-like helix-turn-helix DNA-binding protein [Bacteroidota bacterium]
MAPLSKLINYHIEELKRMENLSERTKNVCIEGSLDTLFKILYYFLERNTFRDIRNCGLKTDMELITLSKKYLAISGLTLEDLRMNEPLLGFEDFKLFCYVNFKVPSEVTETYKDAFISKEFPLFSYVQTMINFILNDREQYIFNNNYGFLEKSQKRTLQAIGDHYSITRERVRQISQKVPDKVFAAVSKISHRFVNIDKHFDYGLDLKKEIIVINQELVDHINKSENLVYTGKLYSLVFAGIFQRYFISTQSIENNYHHYYLVSRKYKEIFDFKAFINDIEERNSVRITNDIPIDIFEYLNHFVLPGQIINDRLKQICKRIALEEFGLGYDKTNIIFRRNSLVKLSEHIISILAAVGRPMKLTEICKELKTRSKRIPPNIESLRSSILSIEEVAAIGKTSTYALKEWDLIKTGTIKELVKEFLESSPEPKHISDIALYVNKFRKTTDKNILSNLKLDKTNTYVFFKLGYIGLKYKQYRNIQINSDKKARGRRPKTTKDDGQLSLL